MVCHPPPQLHPAFPPTTTDNISKSLFDARITARMSIGQHDDRDVVVAAGFEVWQGITQQKHQTQHIVASRDNSASPMIEFRLGGIARHVIQHERLADPGIDALPDLVDYGGSSGVEAKDDDDGRQNNRELKTATTSANTRVFDSGADAFQVPGKNIVDIWKYQEETQSPSIPFNVQTKSVRGDGVATDYLGPTNYPHPAHAIPRSPAALRDEGLTKFTTQHHVRDARVTGASAKRGTPWQRPSKRKRRFNRRQSTEKDGAMSLASSGPSNPQLEDMMQLPANLNLEERRTEAHRLGSQICALSGLDLSVKWREHQDAGRTEGAIRAIQEAVPWLTLSKELIKVVLVKEIAKTRSEQSGQNLREPPENGRKFKSSVNNVPIGSTRASLFSLDAESPKCDSVAQASAPESPPAHNPLAADAIMRAVKSRELELQENTTLLTRARREVVELATVGCISTGARQEVMRLERNGWELRDSINGLKRSLGGW